MGYVFLLIASFAGITKMAAMKGCGKVCPGAYNSVRINAFRSLLCAAGGACRVSCFGGARGKGRVVAVADIRRVERGDDVCLAALFGADRAGIRGIVLYARFGGDTVVSGARIIRRRSGERAAMGGRGVPSGGAGAAVCKKKKRRGGAGRRNERIFPEIARATGGGTDGKDCGGTQESGGD